MECIIDQQLKKIKPSKITKLKAIRRYLKMKIKIDIEPIALSRRISRLKLLPVLE